MDRQKEKLKSITNKSIFTEMKKDKEHPNQENYKDLVFLKLKDVLSGKHLTPHEIMKIQRYSNYFCNNIKRILKKHRGKLTGKIMDTKHSTFFNKLVDVSTFECDCQDCIGNLLYCYN